jgi:hypothetical protein
MRFEHSYDWAVYDSPCLPCGSPGTKKTQFSAARDVIFFLGSSSGGGHDFSEFDFQPLLHVHVSLAEVVPVNPTGANS